MPDFFIDSLAKACLSVRNQLVKIAITFEQFGILEYSDIFWHADTYWQDLIHEMSNATFFLYK